MQAVRRALIALVAVMVVFSVVPEAVAHREGWAVNQLARGPLADPGAVRSTQGFHLYGTGRGFPTLSSTLPGRGFRPTGPAMRPEDLPRWFGTGVDGSRHLWAPHVERVRGRRGAAYLMYFAATRRGGYDCIGVARSARPAGGFRAVGRPLVCGGRRATTIDPSVYIGPGGGRWLAYVRRDKVNGVGQVRLIALTASGLRVRPGARSRLLVSNGQRITEAPSLIRRGGQTWLFVSRFSYRGCGYRTEVYRARTAARRFLPAGPDHGRLVLRGRSGQVLCGAGGADVLRTGRTVRLYFHAWRGGVEATGGRRAPFVAKLRWRNGRPVVARGH